MCCILGHFALDCVRDLFLLRRGSKPSLAYLGKSVANCDVASNVNLLFLAE